MFFISIQRDERGSEIKERVKNHFFKGLICDHNAAFWEARITQGPRVDLRADSVLSPPNLDLSCLVSASHAPFMRPACLAMGHLIRYHFIDFGRPFDPV